MGTGELEERDPVQTETQIQATPSTHSIYVPIYVPLKCLAPLILSEL